MKKNKYYWICFPLKNYVKTDYDQDFFWHSRAKERTTKTCSMISGTWIPKYGNALRFNKMSSFRIKNKSQKNYAFITGTSLVFRAFRSWLGFPHLFKIQLLLGLTQRVTPRHQYLCNIVRYWLGAPWARPLIGANAV